jgi:glutathione S-transferase
MQPVKVYNGRPGTGPNPWKVIIVLAELDLPYEIEWIDYGEVKDEPYTLLNPNGRLPTIVDPNTGVTLFETGAIINYIVDIYDKDLKLTYGHDRLADKYLVQSWLMFQMSGQGPSVYSNLESPISLSSRFRASCCWMNLKPC